MLNARHVEALHAVMRAGSVRGAAQMLGMAQPGLSRMIKHIEDRLGFALFDRSSGRLVPTQEAHLLARHIEEVHKGLIDLDQVARRLASGDRRLFRIAASPSLGHSIVPEMLAKLVARRPGVVLQFDILSVEQTDDYLELGRGDFTLTVFAMTSPSIHSVRLGSAPLVLAVHADDPLAAEASVTPDRLVDAPFVTFREDTPHGRAIASALGGHPANVRAYVRFGETALAFVARRLGVAIVDAFTAEQARDPAIRIVPIVGAGALPVFLNRNISTPRSAIGESFETIAKAMLRKGKGRE
jgi:DNA-binding transcriptional LysR family regulator